MKKIIALLLILSTLLLVSCNSSESADIEDVLNELIPSESDAAVSSTDTSSETTAPNSMKLTFLGDCLISTYKGGEAKGTFNWYAKNYPATYFFEKVYDTLSADDYTIANCETVLTDRKLTERAKGGNRVFWFYGPTENAKIFTAGSVEVTGVVNNHMKDYGQAGYEDTLAALKKENLIVGDYNKPVYLEKNGIKAAIMFVNLWSFGEADKIITDMKKLDSDTDYKIIYFHGGVEATNYPEQWKVNACRKLIDSGANFVIGMHPHVLQPIEEYNGGVIVYSLGNFLFGGNTAPVKNTIMYQIELKKGSFTMDNTVMEMKDYSLVMKIMFKATEMVIAKGCGGKVDYENPEFRMMINASAGGPLRSMQISGGVKGGVFPGLLEMANGHFFKGILKMITG